MTNTQKPLVSVVVPVYKTEAYLDQCIQSILGQSYENLEILLVDDESSDGCPALCDAYAARYSCVRALHQKNAGAAMARKTGLEHAAGEYILFLDGDDWIDPDTIGCCVDAALSTGAGCVLFGYIREHPDRSMETPLFDRDEALDEEEAENRIHRRLVGPVGEELAQPHRIDSLSSMCMKLYRADVAGKGRIISEREVGTSEDTIFNLYALDGCAVSCLRRCFYHYRKTNTHSITTAHKPDLAEKWDVMYGVIREYLEDSGKAEAYHTPFRNRVACGMIGLGLNEVGSRSSLWKKSGRIRSVLRKPLYREAFSQLDISCCGIRWKVFFLLCKWKAALPLTVLLQIMNYLRSRMAA